jgi:hypothetical protein
MDEVEIIEVGKSYRVSAYWKKSLTEIEMFSHEDGRRLNTEVQWRNGEFVITIANEEEADELQSCLGEDGEIWDYESFERIEMWECFDGCWEDFVHYGNSFSEEEREALSEEYEACEDACFSRYDFLEDLGFEAQGCNWQIHGGVVAYESEEEAPSYD